MKVVALISGGKDSIFNIMQCVAAGHEIVALANLTPHGQTELDSYMYQSVGHEAIDLIATALEKPVIKLTTLGKSIQLGKHYEPSENDEVEDLFNLLSTMRSSLKFDAVSIGAILSDYQRVRVENVCIRLGLTPLAYLWQRNQEELLNEMIKCEVDAIVIKVAALGLDPAKHLGRTLSQMQPHLHDMHEKYGLNVCGEGGEYETLTLDCPLFCSRLIIVDSEIVLHSDDPIAPVGYLKFNKLRLEKKIPMLELPDRLRHLPLKSSDGYVMDQFQEVFTDSEQREELEVELTNNTFELNTKVIPNSLLRQKVMCARSSEGWLSIGGIQGESTSPNECMQEAMAILKSTLEENNHSLSDLCSITMFISDMEQYLELNRVYVETLNHANPPSRACVQVPLDWKCPVTIEALSWSHPGNTNSGENLIDRSTMHVQSRSHWAPANIGPYSQAVRIGDLINLAGQIGLVPGSLELVKGGIKSQCQLVLRHIGRLLKAVDSNVHLRDVVQGVCYVTDLSHVEPCRQIWEGKTNNAIVDYIVVTGLPKNALVEWHVWAHRHNNQFEYEETGKCIGAYSISIFRRWNYENNIATIVSHLDHAQEVPLEGQVFLETLEYTLRKLEQGHENDSNSVYTIKVFYSTMKNVNPALFLQHLEDLRESKCLVYTIVPVVYLKTANTILSICGVRFQ